MLLLSRLPCQFLEQCSPSQLPLDLGGSGHQQTPPPRGVLPAQRLEFPGFPFVQEGDIFNKTAIR